MEIIQLLKKFSPAALCCNEANLFGKKDWFILYLSTNKTFLADDLKEMGHPHFFEEITLTCVDTSLIRQLICNGSLLAELSNSTGACYVLKGSPFKEKYLLHRKNMIELENMDNCCLKTKKTKKGLILKHELHKIKKKKILSPITINR